MGKERGVFKEKIEAVFDYFVWVDGGFKVVNSMVLLRHLVQLEERYGRLWSARMTGLLGRHTCPAGNGRDGEDFHKKLKIVPKNHNEVLLAFGDAGLIKLIELGFGLCPRCRPEDVAGCLETLAPTVKRLYGFDGPRQMLDREAMPIDVRRLKWEELPVGSPGRIYLPKGLTNEAVAAFEARLAATGRTIAEIGYYDHNAPGRFVSYR